MIVTAIYCGGEPVQRIWLGGQVIWPTTTELSVAHIAALFSGGYHAMQFGDTLFLSSYGGVVSVPEVNPNILPIASMHGDIKSRTYIDGHMEPLPAILCVCDLESATRAEVDPLIANAVRFFHTEDYGTPNEISSLIAGAVYGIHIEDQGTPRKVAMLPAGAVCGTHTEDQGTKTESPAIIAGAVYGAHTEDQGTQHEAPLIVADTIYPAAGDDNATSDDATAEIFPPVHLSVTSDSRTDCVAHMIPFRVSGVVEMDVDAKSRTETDATLSPIEAVGVSSLLQLITKCEANLLTAPVAGMQVVEASRTAVIAALNFDGEEPEIKWYDPIKTGSNLYIRSVWLSYQDRNKAFIDTDVWYEVIREGNNLYIRSVDSSWIDENKAYIDLSVFYAPKQTSGNLYIRSADFVWTDGSKGNIDTEFFLEPVQEKNNLHIRQNIFGGD